MISMMMSYKNSSKNNIIISNKFYNRFCICRINYYSKFFNVRINNIRIIIFKLWNYKPSISGCQWFAEKTYCYCVVC